MESTRQGRDSRTEGTRLPETLVQIRLTLGATSSASSGIPKQRPMERPGRRYPGRGPGSSHSTVLLGALGAPGGGLGVGGVLGDTALRGPQAPGGGARARELRAPPPPRRAPGLSGRAPSGSARAGAPAPPAPPAPGSRSPGKHQSDARFLPPAASRGRGGRRTRAVGPRWRAL